jgi:hypothetical protein
MTPSGVFKNLEYPGLVISICTGAPVLFLGSDATSVEDDTSKIGESLMEATFHCALDAGSRRISVREISEELSCSKGLRGGSVGV